VTPTALSFKVTLYVALTGEQVHPAFGTTKLAFMLWLALHPTDALSLKPEHVFPKNCGQVIVRFTFPAPVPLVNSQLLAAGTHVSVYVFPSKAAHDPELPNVRCNTVGNLGRDDVQLHAIVAAAGIDETAPPDD
jgi:hypothetical protein